MLNRKQTYSGSLLRQRWNDADAAAGTLACPPSASVVSLNTLNTKHGNDLEIFDDLVSEPVLVLGIDISHLSRTWQFASCATGVFSFSLLYGYLQELISVHLCSRQLGLFQAMMQFTGYTALAYWMNEFVYAKRERLLSQRLQQQQQLRQERTLGTTSRSESMDSMGNLTDDSDTIEKNSDSKKLAVPWKLYVALSLLRAVDLAMTNLAMQYINYPAKTLMKSSRVVFTMMFGVFIQRKRYAIPDYLIVLAMVIGLVLFMHADANSSAVFHGVGVFMLMISLICDAFINNVSERIMSQYGVGQDEFIFRLYSVALIAIAAAAALKGDLREGLMWLTQPGTYDEFTSNATERTWSVGNKLGVLILFSSMGFFGSSCSAAITKHFGALTMSITSTARKATTLFLSFFYFGNVCTVEHVFGIMIFMGALTTKSLRRGRKQTTHRKKTDRMQLKHDDVEKGLSKTTMAQNPSPQRTVMIPSPSSARDRSAPRSRGSMVHVV